MPIYGDDYDKCKNKECPWRKDCWRYRSKTRGDYISVSLYKPDSSGNCEGYFAILPGYEVEEWNVFKENIKEIDQKTRNGPYPKE